MKKLRKVFLLSLIIVILTNCTGCTVYPSPKTAIVNGVYDFATYYVQLINIFSINSDSEMVSSKRAENSVLIEYKNGDVLLVNLNISDSGWLDVRINYTSDNFLSVQEISDMVLYISCKKVQEYEKELIESFVENKSSVEFKNNDTNFRLEYEDGVFKLSSFY